MVNLNTEDLLIDESFFSQKVNLKLRKHFLHVIWIINLIIHLKKNHLKIFQ